MEVLCNGRVGNLFAGISGREVIEILGIFVGLFPFIDAHCAEKLKCWMRVIGMYI